ncbi:MAG: CehA/McbA family metallohydrolase [Chloroflexi bacterium]|nr:CehA/McbA family metallohydrolase [Chloroflexota bacterium]
MTEIVLEGHFDAQDQIANEFPLLPFEVPPGTIQIHVRYQVNRQLGGDKISQQQGNIVDIGLFDPRGTKFLTAQGFRGWSGTARQEFTIAVDEATPGYLAGPVQPGIWHILLGLYQLAPEGCDYRVVITLEEKIKRDKKTKRQRDKGAKGTEKVGSRWYRGDLHAHSWHSDGSASLADLAAAARAQELDFIAITEHNTVSHLPLLPPHSTLDLLLIPGIEISTYHGHANVWPADSFVEFRCWTDEQMAQVRKAVRARGALFSVNHPKDSGPPWKFGNLFEPDCIEVWGAPWFISNYQSLAVWDKQLRQGKRITAVGGSDKHQGPFTGKLGWYEIGTPCTWIYADALSTESIIASIRAGRVFISEGPTGPQIELSAEAINGSQEATMGDELHLPAGANPRLRCRVQSGTGYLMRLVSTYETREVEITDDDFSYEWQITVDKSTYWRAEVTKAPETSLDEEPAALMAKALSNPIYIRRLE